MSDQVRVNGNLLSWGSITVKINDERFTGFSAIGYGDARERVKGYGMGKDQAPRGRSRGKYTTDPVTLTGPKETMQELRAALARAGDGVSYGDTEFEIVVSYVEANEAPITVEIEQCVWVKNVTAEEEGPDPLKEDIEIDCMRIKRNGLTLYESQQGATA